MFNFEAMKERGISVDEVETHMIRALESCPMIEKMWSARTLSNNGYDEGTPYLEQFQNSFHPDRSSDLIPQLKQLHVHRMGDGTGHGSPHEYDTHVPLIFMHPNIKSQKIDREVALVDTAVTLAGLLGLEPPKDVDGVDRSALVLH